MHRKSRGIREILAIGQPQYRPAMVAYYQHLVEKVKGYGARVGGKWVVHQPCELVYRETKLSSSKIVLLTAVVDDDPAMSDMIKIQEEARSPDLSSTRIVTYTRREESRMLGLLGRREVLMEETEGFVFYHEARPFYLKSVVKIDARTGRELQDVTRGRVAA